jgi:plastocyanin
VGLRVRGTVNRTPVRKVVYPAVAASLALGLGSAGCGSSGSGATAGTIAPVRSGEVAVAGTDNYFVDEEVTVTEGSDVVWTNEGRNQHNILPVDGTPFEAETADFEPGESYRWTASVPGTYRYYCSIHGTATAGMVGTIQVVAP